MGFVGLELSLANFRIKGTKLILFTSNLKFNTLFSQTTVAFNREYIFAATETQRRFVSGLLFVLDKSSSQMRARCNVRIYEYNKRFLFFNVLAILSVTVLLRECLRRILQCAMTSIIVI